MKYLYVTLDIIALMFEGVILLRLLMSANYEKDRYFRHLVIVSMVMSITDMFWSLCYENLLGLGVKGLDVASALYFSSCAVMSYWWFFFVLGLLKKKPLSTKIHRWASMPAMLVILVCATNSFTGWMYTIGSTCYSYARGPFYATQQVCTYGYFAVIMVLSLIGAAKSKNKEDLRHYFILFCVAFVPLTVGFLQVYTAYLPYSCVSYSLAITIIYLFISVQEEEEQKRRLMRITGDLEEAIKKADAANEAKTRFLFNMSHDIRTPMNAIIGFRDLLEKHQDDPEKRRDYLRKIEDADNILLSIINNVLEMARISNGSLSVDEQVYCIEQFNDSLNSIFDELMLQKNIEFIRETNIQHEYIYCDVVKLREIYANILSNAYKYTNPGGSVSIKTTELPYDREGYALYRVEIADTGIGMSKEFLPHVFEEFARENNTTDAKVEGTGLGMPIVKYLVELMGGTIEVESEKGVGTTFIMTMPHRIADMSELMSHKSADCVIGRFDGRRILLAEDNDLNAEIATEILKGVGIIVERAEDGEICVQKYKEKEHGYYDLILMDIQMPNMNGYDATRAIRLIEQERETHIPIIAMTANAFEEDKREAMKAGMDDHLSKPVDITKLMSVLAEILNKDK
ncbi:MAG: response regulator [Eubacteriales bacterium]|nr:response regulator [Eubacteriales bacterium]